GETQSVCWEFCIEPPDGQDFPAYAQLLGSGIAVAQYRPYPIFVGTGATGREIVVVFKTSEMDPDVASARSLLFSLVGAARPYRICIQIDLVNGVCSAFLNNAQVAFSGATSLTGLAGLRFMPNEYYPFMIGTSGPRGPVQQPGTGLDLRLYGLRV